MSSDTGESHRANRRPRRSLLFGVGVDALTIEEAICRVAELLDQRQAVTHASLNAEVVVEMQRNERVLEALATADLVTADGMSIVWASRLLGERLPERVTGIDLFDRLLQVAARDDRTVYLLGATDEVVRETAARLGARFPSLRIVGYRNGYWDDEADVVAAVRRAAPDLLFVALPAPMRELWIMEHLDELNATFVMGVGGAFDVVAGRVSRAPRLLQETGLEWAWRLAHEPRRLYRRYLFGNAVFGSLVARAWIARCFQWMGARRPRSTMRSEDL